MGALAGDADACTCDHPGTISDDKLKELELRLLAKLEEAINQSAGASTDNIVLTSSYGVLLWGMLGNLLVIWLVKISCMVSQIVGFTEALCKLKLFKFLNDRQSRTSNDADAADVADSPSDMINEGARALAAAGIGNSNNNNSSDIQEKEEEMSCREYMKWFYRRIKKHADEKLFPATANNCREGVNPSSSKDHVSAASPDSVNIPVGMFLPLPNDKLTEEHKMELCRNTMDILDTRNVSMQSGSTFLSADIHIQLPSGLDDLFDRAVRLVKMGFRFDPACTVQLGADALLYTTSGENVKTILLEQGVHDVPIITSVQRFYTKTIMIKGFYLKEAQMKASISTKKSVCLNVIYYQELDEGLEVLFAQIPQDEILGEKTLIYANKSIHIEGYENPLVLRSIPKKIDIHKHPSTILGTLCTRQIWITLSLLFVYQVMVLKVWHMAHMEWAFQLIGSICSLLIVEYIIGPWTFYIITHLLQYMMRSTNLDNILVLKEISKSSGDDDHEYTDPTLKKARVDEGGPVNDKNWEWPCYERVLREGRWVKQHKVEDAETNEAPFEEVRTLDNDGNIAKVKLIVHSPLLIQVLKECEPKTDAVFRKGSKIDPKEIFYRREALTAYVDKYLDRMDSVWHVKHVLRFMERHFEEMLEKYSRMKAEGCVSFDMLWTFFMPGDMVCRLCLLTDQECLATIHSPASYNLFYDRPPSCSLKLNVMDFNVRSYSQHTIDYTLHDFKGEVPFTSLQVWPLHVFPNRIKDMQNRCIFVGDLFYQVAMQHPFCFRQFKGSINFYQSEGGCLRLRKLNADGRVMIDLLSFARMNPDYPLRSAQPPCEVMVGTWTPQPGQMKKPSDEKLMMAPAFAYGFSFRLKKWGCFELCGFREIYFNEEAFEALRMKNENQKAILWSVVQQYTASESGMQNDNESIDPIANKGTGCIVLCHGPPGTGKTLTAEALAETLRRPLWSISAFELGDEADRVEETLGQILEIAHLWRAILLLDEADAYLERRGEGVDVKRNMLTGVFLRVLEYYRGIMFLTTNRVTAFDDAILSRTTLAISYPPLDDMQRRAIWEKLLLKHTSLRMDDATFQDLLQHKLNGREIRNIVHLAQILAHAHRRPLQRTDLFTALNASTEDLP